MTILKRKENILPYLSAKYPNKIGPMAVPNSNKDPITPNSIFPKSQVSPNFTSSRETVYAHIITLNSDVPDIKKIQVWYLPHPIEVR
ncbi:unnamed protein product [Blepharisma stoltei]|uniref:Uncharacterized protein n=1 Tax=Blepharisma stoltei TaxID=1481888 RepID=A0AAU9JFB7_9CILI|nr:unnamed protein product [Blepharisma stoltei]